MNPDLPATGADAEVVDDRLDRRESGIAIVATDENVIFAETNDVEATISCDISKETEMTVETPTTGGVTKVVQSDGGRAEVQTAVVSGN
jgi:hypothetical protein